MGTQHFPISIGHNFFGSPLPRPIENFLHFQPTSPVRFQGPMDAANALDAILDGSPYGSHNILWVSVPQNPSWNPLCLWLMWIEDSEGFWGKPPKDKDKLCLALRPALSCGRVFTTE